MINFTNLKSGGKTFLTILLFPSIVFLMDFIIRFEYLKILNTAGFINYSLSFVYEALLYVFLLWLISLVKKSRKYVVICFAVFIAVLQLLVYGHYFYFGVLPNNYSINYLFDHFHDSLTLTIESLRKVYALIFLALASIHFFAASFSLKEVQFISRKKGIAIASLFLLMTLFFNNNVRFQPASYSFTPATIFSVKYVLQERFFGGKFLIQNGYVQRKFEVKDRVKTSVKYNVLLFISESVKGNNLHYNGYERETSPFIDSLIQTGKVIPFHNHFSNSVSTQFSVPIILSGNYTIEKLNQPYVYDYIKSWTNATTFFFSSQSMKTDNIDLVFNTSLDNFICQENSGKQMFNDRGINDHDLMPDVADYLNTLGRKKFLGVIQFNNTHYPYKSSRKEFIKYRPCPPASLNAYDNTIYEQDFVLRDYFKVLGKKNLLDSTIIIFTSDHGEGFSEHNHSGHLQTLYNEDIAVPFWIYLPPGFPVEKRNILAEASKSNTSHLSIFPTILDLFGLPDSSKLNLKPSGYSLFHNEADKEIPSVGLDMLDTKSIVYKNYKFIYSKKDNIEYYELYDFIKDKKEVNNLWDKTDEKSKAMFHLFLHEWEKHRTSFTGLNKPL
ncbi:MAG: sulfatase-like hydrolase/transferase [Ignavibacteria bacterium]|nr:sulfatase-like hydrolase/transferase [Ignavibacteria bacterium]